MLFKQEQSLSKSHQLNLENLRDYIKNLKKVCVAYSGGVDSALIALISHEQLGNKAIAITGVSPALAPNLLEEARQQARWIGINHQECLTDELLNPGYNKNPENRCFACKSELHAKLIKIATQADGATVIDGVNHDDLSDYRPGINAAIKAGVISPLAQLKINKHAVRSISRSLGAPWWDKPAQPCLSSRITYGERINAEKLSKIAKAEQWLISKGFAKVRVRMQGLTARIEVPTDQIETLAREACRKEIINYFLSIGFNAVCIDLEGLISGKLNREIT